MTGSPSQGLQAGQGSWSVTGKRVVPGAVINPYFPCRRGARSFRSHGRIKESLLASSGTETQGQLKASFLSESIPENLSF